MTTSSATQIAVQSSTVLAIGAIDLRRRDLGVTLEALLAAARVSARTWDYLRAGRTRPQPRTLIKLSRALDRLATGEPASPPASQVSASWRLAVLFLSAELGADADLALRPDDGVSRPFDPAWMKAARARQLAFYLVHVELQVSLTALAEACGTTKQRVHKAARTVEDLRDKQEIDALLSRAAAAVTGRASL